MQEDFQQKKKACKKILFYFYFYGSLNSDIIIRVINNILFRVF